MQRFWEIIKTHPLWVAGGVLAGVILIWLATRGGSSGSSGSSGIYAMTADPNITAANAAQAIAQNQTNAAVSIAQQQASVDTAQIAASTSIYSQYFDAMKTAVTAQYGTQAEIAKDTNATAANIASIAKDQAVQINAQNVAAQQSGYNASIVLAGLQTSLGLAQAQSAGQLAQAQSYYGRANQTDWGYNAGPNQSATAASTNVTNVLQTYLEKLRGSGT